MSLHRQSADWSPVMRPTPHALASSLKFAIPGLSIGRLGWLKRRRARQNAQISSVLQRRDP